MKEPVDHILRPKLPWRSEAAITECGYDASQVKTLSRDQFRQRVKELGQQRTAMLTCMTCSQTAGRWGCWEDDPRQSIAREIDWERNGYYRRSENRGQRLRDELIVIADLIEEHKDEFLERVGQIEQRRAWIEKKSALKQSK